MEKIYNSIQEPIDIVFDYIKQKQHPKEYKLTKKGVDIIIKEQPLNEFEKAAIACALVLQEKLKTEPNEKGNKK